jgi:Transmembrane secretion effector
MADGVSERSSGFMRPLRSRSFRGIWIALLASGVGDWAARIALAVLVLERTGSAPLSSLVVAVSFVPWLGPGQILATRLSHVSRVKVMVGADLLRAVVYAVLLVHLPIAVILVLVFVAALATPPFETARSALTVEAVPGEVYGSAIALLDVTDQSAIVLGYLLGGLWLLLGGYQLALVANVASFLVSAAALATVGHTGPAKLPEAAGVQLRRALAVLRRERVIRRGVLFLVVAALPVAAVEATAAVYSHVVLHAGPSRAGELAAAVPLGILVAVPWLPRSGTATRLLRAAALVAMVGGLAGAVAFGAGGTVGALIGYFAAGVLSSSGTPAQIAFQPRVRAEDRTGVFSVAQGLLMGGQALGAVLGGVAANLVNPRHAAIGWMVLVIVLIATMSALVGFRPDRDDD